MFLILAPTVAAIALAMTFVISSFGPAEQVLIDPSGRPVATIHDGDTVRESGPERRRKTGMSWHLWGLADADAAPVYLGLLGDGDLVIGQPDRFHAYAMSLENRDFFDADPTGPVILLLVEK